MTSLLAPGNVTPQERVQQFLATVEDYEGLESAIPLGNSINHTGHGDDNVTRWHVALHAMTLRKYFARKDRLFLPRVVAALQECVVKDDLQPSEWKAISENVHLIEEMSLFWIDEGPRYSESQLLEAQLYGRYLHGDFEKWKVTRAAQDRLSDQAVFMATVSRASRVIRLAEFIRDGIQDTSVELD